jgi:hypothetical protein
MFRQRSAVKMQRNDSSRECCMSRTLVVFGAQTSLGAMVARQYGNGGYDVVLVADHAHSVQGLTAVLGSEGVYPQTFISALATPEQARELVQTIRAAVGPIDALFYSPPSPASDAKDTVDLTLAFIFGEVLPEMRARKAGTLLVAPSSLRGNLDCANRRYLQFLQGESANQGVRISALTVKSLFCQEQVLPLGGRPLNGTTQIPMPRSALAGRRFFSSTPPPPLVCGRRGV